MKYFLLRTDPLFDTAPDIQNWYQQLDKRNIMGGRSHRIPSRQLMYIRPNENVFFTDVLSFPFFLVTSLIYDVIKLYEPRMLFKEIVLLDNVNANTCIYQLPILKPIDCLHNSSKLTLDHSKVIHAVLDADKIGDSCIFQLSGVSDTHVVARLDIVESFLRRGACGIGLEEIDTVSTNSADRM